MGFVCVRVGMSLLFFSQLSCSLATSGRLRLDGAAHGFPASSRLQKNIQEEKRRKEKKPNSSCVNPGEGESFGPAVALTPRSNRNKHADCTPGCERSHDPPFSLCPCPVPPQLPPSTPHTVWHLNPANGIISPRGQFSRMENSI